jgi:hypothetical protein
MPGMAEDVFIIGNNFKLQVLKSGIVGTLNGGRSADVIFLTRIFFMKKQIRLSLLHFIGVIFLLQLLLGCSDPGYYVSVDGNDENPGTRKKPIKTIAKVNSLILKPGDAIFFKGGETFEGTLSLSLPGNPADCVKISSYGEGKAIINGGNQTAVRIRGRYFRLERIHAIGSGRKSGNVTNGVTLMEAQHGVVENIETEGFQKSGLELLSCRNIRVEDVLAIRNGFSGIHVIGTDRTRSGNIVIKDSRAEDNPGDPTNLEDHSGNGILVARSDSVLVDHCVATKNGWDMPRVGNGPVGIWAYESSHIIFQYCISYGNRTSKGSKDGGGFDFDGGISNSIMQYCLSYNNEGAGYGLFQYAGASLWYNNVVRYCLSINDATTTEGSGGIFMWNGTEDSVQLADCHIHNNLVYTIQAPAVRFEPSSLNKNFRLYNNIFIGKSAIIDGPTSGEKFFGNVWWNDDGATINFRGYHALSEWSRATGQEMIGAELIGRQIDPLLKGPLKTHVTDPYELHTLLGYTLSDRSPVIDTGVDTDPLPDIPSVKRDFFGTQVPQGSSPDPGIHEWGEN